MQSLPSHRRLLSSLVASLWQVLLPDEAGSAADHRRGLLLTLHVIFPSIVLPALDLLDRGLVARTTVAAARSGRPVSGGRGREDDGVGAADPVSSPSADHAAGDPPASARVYVVQSLASTLTRRGRREPASASRRYIVHPDAWSCSCASFALETFASHAKPTALTGRAPSPMPPSPVAPGDHDQETLFGGMSADGLPGRADHVPCCKHLLACLLAEQWGGLLARQVDVRRVTKEELAGILSGT